MSEEMCIINEKEVFFIDIQKSEMSYYGYGYQKEPEMSEEERSDRLKAMTLTNPNRDDEEAGFITRDRNEYTNYDEMMTDYIQDNYLNGRR